MSEVTEATIIDFILNELGEVDHAESNGDHFFMVRTDAAAETDRRMPLATIITSDRYDEASDLGREGVFRLNIGVGQERFDALFRNGAGEVDHTVLDRVMPHPLYAGTGWVCLLNPEPDTWEEAKTLLTEAYAVALRQANSQTTH